MLSKVSSQVYWGWEAAYNLSTASKYNWYSFSTFSTEEVIDVEIMFSFL